MPEANSPGRYSGSAMTHDSTVDPLVDLARSLGAYVECGPETGALPIGVDEAVLVVGSQAFNEADRSLERSDIRSLQILRPTATISRGRFDAFGARGLRDFLALHDGVHALTTTANDLVLHNLVTNAQATWAVSDLADIHTLTAEGEAVLVASTATDEVVEIGLDGVVRGRVGLAPLRHENAQPIAHDKMFGGVVGGGANARVDPAETLHAQDHFHANEAFTGHDGHRYAVVHHASGFRPILHATNRLVGHGSGGVVDLTTMRAYDLELVAPHSARLVDGGYAIIDSGRQRLVLTEADWTPTGEIALPGWGRGFGVSADRRNWYVGISATRRRYLRPRQTSAPNAVAVVREGHTVATRVITGVEQIWSVHVVASEFAERLLRSMSRVP
jgi:hypothetical protein